MVLKLSLLNIIANVFLPIVTVLVLNSILLNNKYTDNIKIKGKPGKVK